MNLYIIIRNLTITDTTTLQDIAEELKIPNAMFFCYRFEDELGTFMNYASNELFSKFNTDRCVILDSTKISDRDQATVTMWLGLYESLSSLNNPRDQKCHTLSVLPSAPWSWNQEIRPSLDRLRLRE